jgi:hypothetical protein
MIAGKAQTGNAPARDIAKTDGAGSGKKTLPTLVPAMCEIGM